MTHDADLIDRSPLHGLEFAVLGPGRVGTSLAAWAAAAGATLVAVAGRSSDAGTPNASARALAERWESEAVPIEAIPARGVDLVLITVADPALDRVVARLAEAADAVDTAGNTVFLHSSGSRGAEALDALARRGFSTGCLHPLKAFPQALEDSREAHGVFFATDGDGEATALAKRLAEAWGGLVGTVPGASRSLYHFAATLAAGGVVTLVAAADRIASGLGLPPAVSRGYLELARGALAAAAAAETPGRAVTGPVARGDAATVDHQLQELSGTFPELVSLTLELARETLRSTDASPADTAALAQLLDTWESRRPRSERPEEHSGERPGGRNDSPP